MPHFNKHRPLRRRHKSRRQLQLPRLMRSTSTTAIQLRTLNLSHTAHYRNPSTPLLRISTSITAIPNRLCYCASHSPVPSREFFREFLISGLNLSIEVRV